MKNFSFKRLFLLIKKQYVDHAKQYVYGIAALIGIMVIAMLIWILAGGKSYNENTLFNLYFVGMFITGAIFASISFEALGTPAKGISWLSLPASHTEKLVCAIVYNLVFFTIIYTICYIPIATCADMYIRNLAVKHAGIRIDHYINWQGPRHASWAVTCYVFLGFFAVQALYLLGSVYFKKYAFISTSAVGALLIVLFIFLIRFLAKSFYSDNAYFNLIDAGSIPTGIWYKKYSLTEGISDTVIFLTKFIWAPFFWLVTWFRLKEKEI